MRTVLFASMRRHTRRYVAAAIAVVVGVAFIVVTNALASAARDGMTSGIDAPYENADVVLSDLDGPTAQKVLDRAGAEGAAAAVLGWAWLPVATDDGHLSTNTDVGALARDPQLRWQELVDGDFATADDEAVVDADTAQGEGIRIGDTLTIGEGSNTLDVEVVGTVDSPSMMVESTVYLTQDAQRRWLDESYVNSIAWSDDGSVADQIDQLEGAFPDVSAHAPEDFVAEQQAQITNGVDIIAMVLLVFAAIALLTSMMVIANTFSILFAQRTRDFALLRCVGATKTQVLRSIRLEALALGAAASTLGLAVGAGLGVGLVAVIRAVAPSAGLGEVTFSPAWIAGGFTVGMLVTLLASWLPTRRVTQVSPLAALRPDAGVDVRTASGRLRIGTGVVSVLVGVLTMAAAVAGAGVPAMVAGGGTTFLGTVVLGPTLVPAMIRAAGALTGRLLGPSGRLAAANAARNPRRTAATTASLLVGVTLTTAVLTGLASGRSVVADEMDTDHPLDASISATDRAALDRGVLADAGDVPAVQDAVAVPGTPAELDHGVGEMPVVAPGPDAADVLRSAPDFADPADGVVHVPLDAFDSGEVPERLTVTVEGTSRSLEVVAGDGWGNTAVVSPTTLSALEDDPSMQAIWMRTDLDADPDVLGSGLEAVSAASDATVESALSNRAYVDLQLDVLTGAMVGLLGIAVLIALVGIANTLGLSILERSRENALLRALGLTRRQLRASLGTEAVLLSVVATLVGTTMGIGFAWVGVQTMLSDFVDDVAMTLPLGQLAAVVVISALAGLAACVLPARRAARVSPAEGLALE